MSRFDGASTTDQVIEGVSLKGKCAVVTGASSGLGLETCRVLAAAGATVLMVARNKDTLDTAAEEIRQRQPDAHMLTPIMHLPDLATFRLAAAWILPQAVTIQRMLSCARVMACTFV